MLIKLTNLAINEEEALQAIRHPFCGALATFTGLIRSENKGKVVRGLEYEVFEAFFDVEVKRIFAEIKKKWPIHDIALIQRAGKMDVGETGIYIAVSSRHRRDALEGCAYTIEEFKKRAPVWKKEFYDKGQAWL